MFKLFVTSWMMVAAATTSQEQVDDVKAKFVEAEQAERQLLGNLYKINQRMKDMSKKRDRLTDRRLVAEGDIRILGQNIALLEKKIEMQRHGLRRRLRSIYQMQGQPILRALFSAHNSVELDRNLKFLNKVNDRDYSLLKNFERNVKSLHRQKQLLDRQVRHLARIQGAFKRQEEQLLIEQESKGQLLAKLKTRQNRHLEELQKLRSLSNEETTTAFFENRGQLLPPVAGEVVKSYGVIQDETYRFRLAHKGVFYSASDSTQVVSVFNAKVAFAGEVPGYGKTAILDHGDHYYTVYGYLSDLKVAAGDQIDRGSVVGMAGGRSPWFGAGVYFEIRHFSDAIDPEPWLKTL